MWVAHILLWQAAFVDATAEAKQRPSTGQDSITLSRSFVQWSTSHKTCTEPTLQLAGAAPATNANPYLQEAAKAAIEQALGIEVDRVGEEDEEEEEEEDDEDDDQTAG